MRQSYREIRAGLYIAGLSMFLCGCAEAQPLPFVVTEQARFDEPWAMEFLPDGRLLVTEKRGALNVWTAGGAAFEISGLPEVAYGGQGGLGDVVLHPDFANNNTIYISYAEAGPSRRSGAAVARATLALGDSSGSLRDVEVIWRQVPKVEGQGHYGHRIAFDSDGFLWISSGERQRFNPAQDMQSNLGKIIRLQADGSIPTDNPFFGDNEVTSQIWSLGHRNPLGLAFDASGQLWNIEMGPRGGDELNRVERQANYGYPIVSNGDHYDGRSIPDHDTRPDLAAPAVSWNPSISPSSLMFYSGTEFPEWAGSAFVGGLSSGALIRVEFAADGSAQEAERFRLNARVREVEQGPDGAIWLLEDGSGRNGGRLVRLTRQ